MKVLNRIKRGIKSRCFLRLVKCIIWDYDGTLYKSDEIGIELKKTFFLISKKYKTKLTMAEFDNKSKLLGSWSAATSFFTSMSEINILDLVDSKIDKLKFIKKNPEIVKFIESTQKKYLHLILTNSTKKEVELGLKKIGFKKNTFNKIFSRDYTKLLKPDVEIYKQIQNFTNLKKNNCLCIGDSLSCDIKPAREFGFKAIPIWELFEVF